MDQAQMQDDKIIINKPTQQNISRESVQQYVHTKELANDNEE